jgi:eukaryotic-like serine/threonine-protein kinase
MIGKTVGKYRIVERLGRGGMGTVYKAIDETLDREVAIKVLNADLGDSDLLKRFRAEAVTLARLNHPGIATLYELYRNDNDLLMVMEFVRGETVHELSERLGALAAPQAAHLAMQVLDALSHAHRAGVVHRDLKPANLMVTEMGIVKVMDFGIARVLGTEHFTQGGYMMGTPAYMAPEQVLGGEIDGRADLYAVGVVLYRLLSGQLPFSADTAIAMVQKQVNESPTPIGQFQPDLPPWCARVLERALAKSPGDRFQTADEFRTALLSAVQPQTLGEMPTMATPTPLGLLVLADNTIAQPTPTGVPQGYSQRASAAAVATPMATSVPGAVPQRATPATPPQNPAAPKDRRPAEGVTTTLVLGRNQLVGFGTIALVLIVGVGAFGFYALRRSSFPQQLQIGAQPAEEAKTPTETPVTKPPDAPPTAANSPADTTPPAVPGAPAPPGAPGAPKAGTDPAAAAAAGASTAAKTAGRGLGTVPGASGTTTTPPAPGARGARGSATTPGTEPPPASGTAAPTTEPAPAPAPEPPPASPTAPVTFNDVRVLVKSGDRMRELTGVLSLGNGQLAVLDKPGGTALVSLPYSSLTGAAYSRSKQPRWKDADGKEVEGKVDLGRLGFFRSERNWVILFTHGEPTFIRVEDGSLRTVLPAIESHAGINVKR